MNYYDRSSETKQRTVFKVVMISQEYINCKKEVDKISLSVKKLIASTRTVLEEVIPTDVTNQIQEQYCCEHSEMTRYYFHELSQDFSVCWQMTYFDFKSPDYVA